MNVVSMGTISGIYEIKNVLNNHRYIGSSVDINKRWSGHIKSLVKNKHHSVYLQRAWNKYGEKHFEFNILEECESIKDTLLFIEQKYLDLRPEYNMSPTAGSPLGYKHSKESRKRLSDAHIGKHLSESHKKQIGDKHRGMKRSEETKKNISQSLRNSELVKLRGKKVSMVCLETNKIINEFTSIREAARYLGNIDYRVNIRSCIKNNYNQACGYGWLLKKKCNDI